MCAATAGILLCAGFGTRLRPLTDAMPKPAVAFLGRPMVWYAMRALRDAGITELAANVHYLPDIMAETLGDCAADLGIPPVRIFREEGQIMGTGGGAHGAAGMLPAKYDNFVIYHGDVICLADIAEAVAEHVDSGCDVSMVTAPRPADSNLGIVGVSDRQVVRIRDFWAKGFGMTGKPEYGVRCFTGIHIVRRRVLESIPSGRAVCLVTEVYPQMMDDGERINACETDAYFADIGTIPSFRQAEMDLKDLNA